VPALKENAGGGGRKTIRVHRVAAMVQIGVAIPFLVIAGVMIDRTRTADFGFPTDGLVAARLPAPSGTGREADFSIRRVRDNLRQTSGVRSVAIADGMPIDFDYREFRIGRTGGADFVTAHVTRVGENFLETVGAPLLRGRAITGEDRVMASPVAVISGPLAELLFPGMEAIGQQVTITLEENREEAFTVVGVSGDFATSQLTTLRPQILLPLPEVFPSSVYLIARGAPGDEPQLKAALEGALRDLGVEPLQGVAFAGVVTGQDLVQKSLGDLVSEGAAVGIAGGLVLVLAALGIVGVVSFMVATRTRELAVRMGAWLHAVACVRAPAEGHRSPRDSGRGRRSRARLPPDPHDGRRHGNAADARPRSARCDGAGDLHGRGDDRGVRRNSRGPPRCTSCDVSAANGRDTRGVGEPSPPGQRLALSRPSPLYSHRIARFNTCAAQLRRVQAPCTCG
jgi:hypothetical protein